MKRRINVFLAGLFSMLLLSFVACSNDDWDTHYDTSVNPEQTLKLDTQQALADLGYTAFSEALAEYNLLVPADKGIKMTYLALPNDTFETVTDGMTPTQLRSLLNSLIMVGEVPYSAMVDGKLFTTASGFRMRYIISDGIPALEGMGGYGYFEDVFKPVTIGISRLPVAISNGLVYEVSGVLPAYPPTLATLESLYPEFRSMLAPVLDADSSVFVSYPSISADGSLTVQKDYPSTNLNLSVGGAATVVPFQNLAFLSPPSVSSFIETQVSYYAGLSEEEIAAERDALIASLPNGYTTGHVARLDSAQIAMITDLQPDDVLALTTLTGKEVAIDDLSTAQQFDNGNVLFEIPGLLLEDVIYSAPKNPFFVFMQENIVNKSAGITSVGNWERYAWTNTNRRGDLDYDLKVGDWVTFTWNAPKGALYANVDYEVYFYYRAKTDRYINVFAKLYINDQLFAENFCMGAVKDANGVVGDITRIPSANPGPDGYNTPEELRKVKLPTLFRVASYATPGPIVFKIEMQTLGKIINNEFMAPRCLEFKVKPKE